MAIEKGEKAPDFSLPSTDGSTFTLYEALENGPVLVNFYIGDFGINCTNYMTNFSERYEELTDLGIVMVGVNSDGEDSHKNFKNRLGLQWELLQDADKKVSKEYGAIVGPGHLVSGFTNREFYLIDRDGTVKFVWRSEIPKQLPAFDEIFNGVKDAL